jgi:hypothetical protein
MILLPQDLRERLLADGRRRGLDHVPVVKFFNPLGIGTWLANELDDDGDTLFSLADLGEPELGAFSLAEMEAVELKRPDCCGTTKWREGHEQNHPVRLMQVCFAIDN